jgi:hypothetical protein
MKCITIRQPWATLLVDPTLPKWIETRSRRTHVRGTIGIIAGLWTPSDCTLDVGDYEMVRWFGAWDNSSGWKLQIPVGERGDPGFPDDGLHPDLPFGALIGTVDLYDCIPIEAWARHHDSHPHICGDGTRHERAFLYPGSVEPEYGDDVYDQLPYGDFTPGRWAWLTRNPVLFDEPRPMRGAQHWQEAFVD